MPLPGSAEVRHPTLIVSDPAGGKSRVRIQPVPFRIGRQADNHLVLRDNRISRSHAQIVMENADYVMEDLESRHGIYVNDIRVTRQKLQSSDRIEFGFPDSYRLIFTLEEEGVRRLADHVSTSLGSGTAAGNLARLRALVEVARALETSLSTEDVLASLVDAALTITRAERGFLLLRNGDDLEVRVARDNRGAAINENDLRVPRSLIHRALRQRRELLSMNFDPASQAALPAGTVAELELRSVVCVPLVKVRVGAVEETNILSTIDETLGLLYMDSRLGAADLSSGNRELLQTLALEASTILENARLLEGERVRQRIEEELKIAREIQESLLPRELPSSGWFRAAGRSIPSHQVGGDYFEVGRISPTCWSVAVADVSGKGVSSALLASLLQGMFLAGAQNPLQMEQMMQRVNRFLLERTGGEKYATLFYCTLDRSGSMRWINAGHCPPRLAKSGHELEALHATALPVGMLEEAAFHIEETRLAPGDKLVVYTDGLSEAQNVEGEFFGDERLCNTILAHAGAGCAELYEALNRAVTAFTSGAVQKDDITLVVAEYNPEA
jgi:sigma-B regulation protein RsbU (phosphoserine phosphatase)